MLNVTGSFKSDFSSILGVFNARSKSWWQNDINTHILLVNSSSCIDLIFTDEPNLVIDCGTHPSLHCNFHHQIIYCKLNLKGYVRYKTIFCHKVTLDPQLINSFI